MHPYLIQFFTIAVVHLVAVASPGPDFAIIVRQSIVHGRKTALWTSLGIGTGILFHICNCLLGIGLVLAGSPRLFAVMKVAGALYLLYLGSRCLRARPLNSAEVRDGRGTPPPSPGQAYRTGLFTNGLNVKATLFFLSLFTVVIDPATPLLIQAGYGLYMAVATTLWFSMLSLLFGSDAVRRRFLAVGHWFDRLTGVVLIALGLRLALTGLG